MPNRSSWLAIISLGLAMLTPLPAKASDETMQIVRFFDAAGTMKAVLLKVDIADMAGLRANPVALKLAQAALLEFDPEEASRRLALVFDRQLDADDIANYLAFIRTPAGMSLAKLYKEHKSAEALIDGFRRMLPEEKEVADTFLATQAAKKAVAAINSPEAGAAARKYGEELACQYVRRTDQALLARFNQAGRCLEEK